MIDGAVPLKPGSLNDQANQVPISNASARLNRIMPDLQQCIEDVLAEHNSFGDERGVTGCYCGATDEVRGNGIEWAEHVASLLLPRLGLTEDEAQKIVSWELELMRAEKRAQAWLDRMRMGYDPT